MWTDEEAVMNHLSSYRSQGKKLDMERVWTLAMARIAGEPTLTLSQALAGAVEEIARFEARGDRTWALARGDLTVEEWDHGKKLSSERKPHTVTATISAYLNDVTMLVQVDK